MFAIECYLQRCLTAINRFIKQWNKYYRIPKNLMNRKYNTIAIMIKQNRSHDSTVCSIGCKLINELLLSTNSAIETRPL